MKFYFIIVTNILRKRGDLQCLINQHSDFLPIHSCFFVKSEQKKCSDIYFKQKSQR